MRYIQVHYILSIAYIYNHIYIHMCVYTYYVDLPMKLVIFQDAQVVARTWRQAFAEFGFCQAIGHGVPDRGRAETDEMMCGIHSVHQKMTWKKKSGEMCLRNRNWGHNFMFWNCGSVWSC